jgi:hypothetical protein
VKWLLPLLALAAGCERFLRLDKVSAVPDAPADAAPDAPPPCTMPFVHDAFDPTSSPCASWGMLITDFTGSTVTADGRLVIQPGPNGDGNSSHAGCLTQNKVSFTEPFFVQVTTLPAGYEYQQARTLWPGGDLEIIAWSSTAIIVQHQPPQAAGVTIAQVPYDPMTTSWVRLNPQAMSVDVEVSGDGLSWTSIGTDDYPPPTTAGLQLVGGTFSGNPAPAAMYFDSMNVCP